MSDGQRSLFPVGELKERTLAEAREEVMERRNDPNGVICPCCDKRAARRPLKISSTMARFLCRLYLRTEQTGEEWHHYTKMGAKMGRHYAWLQHWDLVEMDRGKPKDKRKRRKGNWRITEKGKRFVRDEISVPRSVYVYNNKRDGYGEKRTSIRIALGDRFDYREVMRWIGEGSSSG